MCKLSESKMSIFIPHLYSEQRNELIDTNKTSISPVVLEIACWIFTSF